MLMFAATSKTSRHPFDRICRAVALVTILALAFAAGACGKRESHRERANRLRFGPANPDRIVIRPAATQPGNKSSAGGSPTGDGAVVVPVGDEAGGGGGDGAGRKDKPRYEQRTPTRDGIGKIYMGREIAHVMGHLAAGWLERPEREQQEHPQKVIDGMDLEDDDVVADIGVGTGYFAFRIAERVPRGKVLGVDIQPEMLDLLRRGAEARGVKNVEGVLGTIDDPKLPEGQVDAALMVDAYHEFDHPYEMMTGIYKALKPGGRVVLVEYKAEDPNVPIKPLHKMSEAQAKKEMAAVGLEHVETVGGLPWQHLMIFRKPADEKPKDGGGGGAKPEPKDLLAVAPRFAVRDLKRSTSYFAEKLGFRIDRQEKGLAVVSRDGVSIHLVVPQGQPAGPAGASPFVADCDAYIWTKNADRLCREFRQAGALIAADPERRAEAIEFDVSTPDGGILRFAQRADKDKATVNAGQ